MPKFKGTWRAVVEQDYEIEAANIDEAGKLLDQEMNPRNVVELKDFTFDIEEVGDDEG